ncbi:hypothetical protein OIU79_014717 [Salix purpurea]|uniref:Uncharacterized protein n=1 Tax=Salix purpurea TaxID=77065 RepID=A0A9Q0SWV3_SALPP|nr:hypothetical protein OIU79_014717 [Salix purpurea]
MSKLLIETVSDDEARLPDKEGLCILSTLRSQGMRIRDSLPCLKITWIGLMESGFLQKRWFLDRLLAIFLDKEWLSLLFAVSRPGLVLLLAEGMLDFSVQSC